MSYPQRWAWLALVPALALLMIATAPQPEQTAQAQINRGQHCFPETGYCIAGRIRDYWEQNGGLDTFGYPISQIRNEQLGDWSGPTQWFERDRLEDHGSAGVMASRLGAYLLQLQGRSWQDYPPAIAPIPDSCRYFEETQHSLCEPFLSYWQQNGGVEQIGYPITEPLFETINNTWTGNVQYFERRRLEFHPEQPDNPVQQGLLGYEVLDLLEQHLATPTPTAQTTTPTPTDPDQCAAQVSPLLREAYEQTSFRNELGCPISPPQTSIEGASQACENGLMVWIDRGYTFPVYRSDDSYNHNDHERPRRAIFAVFYFPEPSFRHYVDTWDADDDPYTLDRDAPSGYYPPRGGFGKVWDNDPELRQRIGWALEREEEEQRATIQDFTGGTIVKLHETEQTFVFGNPDEPEQVDVFLP